MKEFISDLGVIPSASGPLKSFVTILVQFPWQKNLDFTREPGTSRDTSIPSAIKSRRETWRFARYIRI